MICLALYLTLLFNYLGLATGHLIIPIKGPPFNEESSDLSARIQKLEQQIIKLLAKEEPSSSDSDAKTLKTWQMEADAKSDSMIQVILVSLFVLAGVLIICLFVLIGLLVNKNREKASNNVAVPAALMSHRSSNGGMTPTFVPY